MAKTKQQLIVENNTQFPNNNTGFISPSRLRTFNVDMIESMVDEIPYGAYTSSVATDSASFNNRIDALEAFTGSITTVDTGSLLVTASAVGSTITFTKGDSSTFGVTITAAAADTSSLVTTASFNAYTASTDSKFVIIEATTASLNTSVGALNTFTSSTNTKFDNVQASTASLNAFTASAAGRLTNLESTTASLNTSVANLNTTTASLNTSVGALNSFTASQTNLNGTFATTASLNSYTSSANGRLDNLELNTGSYAISSSVAAVDASQQSQIDQLTAFTGSVSSVATGSLLVTASAAGATITFTKGDATTFDVTITATAPDTSSLVTTASFNAYTSSANGRLDNIESTTASLNTSVSNLNSTTASQANLNDTFVTTASLNAYTASTDGRLTNIESTTASLNTSVGALNSFTASQNSFNTSATASIEQLLSFSSSLDTGYVTEAELAAATGALENQINTKLDTASFNSYTSSANGRLDNLESTTASLNISVGALNTFTASASESLVTAIVTNVGSNYYVIDGVEQPKLSFVPGPTYRFDLSGIAGSHPFKFSTSPNGPTEYTTGVTSGSNFIQIEVGYNTASPLYYYCTNHSGMGNEINVLAIDELATTASLNAFTASADGRLTNIEATTASLNTSVANLNTFTASQTNLNGTFATTASFNSYTSSANGRLDNLESTTASLNTSVEALNTFTSSQELLNTTFATTGSNTFNGNQTITGSLTITGSAYGNVNTLSVTSNTASMDMSAANFFVLTLPTGSTTHLDATNVSLGQTVSLLVKQATTATGSLVFSPEFKFPTGSRYTASPTGSAEDIITFVTFNTTGSVFATSVKQLI